MARLKPEVKTYIVQRLACFDTPTQVSEGVKDEFGIEMSRMAIQAYDPTKSAGAELGVKLRKVFEDTRERFLSDTSEIAISHKAVRLRMLQRMAESAEKRGNLVLAASLLEQAAKEVGEAYTNKRVTEVTGKDGGPIETKDTSKMSDTELNARIRELEGKLGAAAGRRKG